MNRIFPMQFLTQFLVLTVARLSGAVAAFVVSLIIARQFGAGALGQYSVLLATVGILSVIASGGYPAIASIFAAKYKAMEKIELLKGFVRSGLKQAILGAALSALVVLAFYISGASAGNIALLWAVILIPIAVLATTMTNFCGSVLVGLNRQVAGLLPDTLLKPLVFAGAILAVVVSGAPLQAEGILACFALASLTTAVVVALQIYRSKLLSCKKPTKTNRQSWQKTAAPWIITTMVWDLFIEIHILIAGWIAAPVEVAILHIVFRFRVLAGFGMRSLYALSLPDIASANAKGNDTIVKALLLKANLLALLFSFAVLVVFAVAGELLMGIFGPEFKAGWSLLLVVSSTMCIRALFGPAPAILAMTGHQKASAAVMLGCLVLSLTGSLVLYPPYGLLGIAISYTIANFFGSAILAIYTKRVTGIDSSLIGYLFQLKNTGLSVLSKTYS